MGLLTPPFIAISPRLASYRSTPLTESRVNSADDELLLLSGTYLIFSLSCLGAFFWAWLVVPETKGRSLEEMDVLFNSDAGAGTALQKYEVGLLFNHQL